MDAWMDSFVDGRKSDVLTLLSLCILVKKNVVVHLKNGQVWNSFKIKPVDNKTAVAQVDIHLIYLGRGIFAQLKPRPTPLQIISNPECSVTTVVIGMVIGYDLTAEENKTRNKLITSGLGVGKSSEPCKIPTATVVKQEKPEQLDVNETSKTLPTKGIAPVPLAQHGLQSDLPEISMLLLMTLGM